MLDYSASSTLSVKEMAVILGVCDETVRRHAWDPQFPIPPIRVGKSLRFPKVLVDRFISSGKVPS